MKPSKKKAIQLIDENIAKFQRLLMNATYEDRYNEDYEVAYYGTETLLRELFSEQEAEGFRRNVSSGVVIVGGDIDYAKELREYRDHIGSCVSQLKVYRERVENFWDEEPAASAGGHPGMIPFVSMSFDDMDRDINQYVIRILEALGITYETGERYSKTSIPDKVRGRISRCDVFVAVFVRRDKIEGGGYTTSSWLHKELGIAQGSEKDVIAWVEKGIKDIAGLNYEKEVIYFERDSLKEMQNATVKFLEALKEHRLV